MPVKDKPFSIREWELQFPKQFLSERSRGRGFILLPVPMEFSVGDYLLLRDVHFLYKNSYPNDLTIILEERIGVGKHPTKIFGRRKETNQGAAYFIDLMIKPKKGFMYYINMPEIPVIAGTYDLWYTVHYRLITRVEFQGFVPELNEFLQNRVIQF